MTGHSPRWGGLGSDSSQGSAGVQSVWSTSKARATSSDLHFIFSPGLIQTEGRGGGGNKEGQCSVQLNLLSAKQIFPSLRGNSLGRGKQAPRPFGHQTALAKQRCAELSVNQPGTYGLHFPENTQGLTNYRHGGLANARQVGPNLNRVEEI